MNAPHPEEHRSRATSLAATVRDRTGIETARCYQCGKCSAGCPMAVETTLRPHDVMRLVNLGHDDRVLADPSIWLCLTCETCTERCPSGCDPARVIDTLRELAGERAPRELRAFHTAFLEQIAATGRMFELGLVMRYKLKTGDLLRDATTTPGLLARGKLKLRPSTIAGVEDVRRIFAACRAAGEEGRR